MGGGESYATGAEAVEYQASSTARSVAVGGGGEPGKAGLGRLRQIVRGGGVSCP